MNKVFSILSSVLILVSGMHLSMATHICQGEVTSKKLSFSGSTASCGMEDLSEQACPVHNSYNSNCCQNKIVVYSIDNNYQSSSYKIQELTKRVAEAIPAVLLTLSPFSPENTSSFYSPPPRVELISQVSLPKICIFRI
jgi:hypothetical protein